ADQAVAGEAGHAAVLGARQERGLECRRGAAKRDVHVRSAARPGVRAPHPTTVEKVVEQPGLARVAFGERGQTALIADPRDDLADHVDAESIWRVRHRAVAFVGQVVHERWQTWPASGEEILPSDHQADTRGSEALLRPGEDQP